MAYLGLPRLGDDPESPRGGPSRAIAHARLAALAGGLATLLLIPPALALLPPAPLAVVGAVLAVASAAVAFTARAGPPRRAAVAAAAGVLSAWMLVGALLALFPRLARGTATDLLAPVVGSGPAAALSALGGLVVVLAVGWVSEAARLELETAGTTSAARAALLAPALAPRGGAAGALARAAASGLAAFGLLGLQWKVEAGARIVARLRGERRVLLRASVDADLSEVGEAVGGRASRARLLLPAAAHGELLAVTGPPGVGARAARALSGPLLFHARFAHSREAVRLERRLNALAQQAEEAVTLEERGALLEEVDAVAAAAEARAFGPEDRAVLLVWKVPTLRVRLAERLGEGAAGRSSPHIAAPGPALLPELSGLLSAGTLAALKDVVYVPWWILPVPTPAGEADLAVDAAGGPPDLAASAALLALLERRAPRILLPAAGRFVPPRPAAEAAEEAARALALRRVVPRAEGAVLVYVPFLPVGDRSVNLLTGEPSGPLPVLPRGSLPAGTLVA